jgi:arsenite transporter
MMKELFEIAFNVSMNTLVAGSMVTMGLSLTVSQIVEPFKNIRMVILSVIANFLIVPLFAFGLVWLLPVSEGVRIGIILVSLGGGAPFIPMVVKTAKGRVAGAIGLMLLLLIVTIFFMPIVVPLIFSGASVSSLAIAKSLIFTMLVPLLLALFVKAYFSDIAVRIQPFASIITNIAISISVIAMVFLYTKTITSNISVLPIILLFFLGSMAIGYFTGGKNRNARIILSVGTGLRNPPITILVASNNFPTEPMAAIVPLLVIIVGLSILFPLARKVSKKETV